MKRKTPGQIAYETAREESIKRGAPYSLTVWDGIADLYKQAYEAAASAVLAEPLATLKKLLDATTATDFQDLYNARADARELLEMMLITQPSVDKYADLKAAHAAGKVIQREHTVDPDKWVDLTAERFQKILQEGYPIKFLRVKPWTLSRHIPGFRPLEDGEEWHRSDFTEDMLPEGYRPLLLNERDQDGDQEFIDGDWITLEDCHFKTTETTALNRTTRPLPPTKAELETKAFETWWNEYKLGCVDITPNRRTAYAAWQAARNQ